MNSIKLIILDLSGLLIGGVVVVGACCAWFDRGLWTSISMLIRAVSDIDSS